MARYKPLRLAVATLAAALAPALALSPTALSAPARATEHAPSEAERALLHSHELWGTIDVCSPRDQPDVVGVRGSMPGNGQAEDKMYMSFRLQYLARDKRWLNLASSASSGWEPVGSGASARQGGTSFDLKPAAGKPPATLRGVVDFQWRYGRTVLDATAVPTTAGHKSLAGADPAGYSAATCAIG
ncbi:MAG TPA: hypothetical protein VMF09_01265 [Solirubrobacteraceae bacterium]|nr:hypothetical protein [Solirubrobacteraceae bacterium]